MNTINKVQKSLQKSLQKIPKNKKKMATKKFIVKQIQNYSNLPPNSKNLMTKMKNHSFIKQIHQRNLALASTNAYFMNPPTGHSSSLFPPRINVTPSHNHSQSIQFPLTAKRHQVSVEFPPSTQPKTPQLGKHNRRKTTINLKIVNNVVLPNKQELDLKEQSAPIPPEKTLGNDSSLHSVLIERSGSVKSNVLDITPEDKQEKVPKHIKKKQQKLELSLDQSPKDFQRIADDTRKLLDHKKIFAEDSDSSFRFMKQMNELEKSQEDEYSNSFYRISGFDSKFIKKRSSLDQTPKESVVLNEEIIKDREKIIKSIKRNFDEIGEPPETQIDFYKHIKKIGKGAFGTVTLGIHKLTGKYVAIKSINKNQMKDKFAKQKVFQEVYIMKKIRHQNVIRLLEVFESPTHLLMVMEYCANGDLLHFIKTQNRMEEDAPHTKFLFKNICFGLANIHCRSVIH